MALPASLIAGVLWQGMGGWDGLGPSAPFIFGAGTALLAVALLPRSSAGRARTHQAERAPLDQILTSTRPAIVV